MNPVSSDRNRKRMKTQHRMETVGAKREEFQREYLDLTCWSKIRARHLPRTTESKRSSQI